MTRSAGAALLALLVALVTSAHVGSPDTWFSGDAGPYRVLVHIKAPGVIPGIAEIDVQVEGEPPEEVLAHVNRFDAVAAAPPPERAAAVRGRPGTYRVRLWVMTGGSNSVTVRVRGPRGEGAVVVPATIVAFRRLELATPMAAGLGVMGLVLFAGLVTIVGTGVRESVLPPGEAPDARHRRRGRVAMALTGGALALAIVGGKAWWDAEDRAYRASMFRPLTAAADVVDEGEGATLRFRIEDPTWAGGGRTFSTLVPDHGKLMHLFLIAEDGGAFAHLHPATADTVTFRAALPPLPAGAYRVFGDVTHESGFAQTLTASVEVDGGGAAAAGGPEAAAPEGPEAAAAADPETAPPDEAPAPDPDDSWTDAPPVEGPLARLADGSTMQWQRGAEPLVAGEAAPLRFAVAGPDGAPAALEPYMGMAAHAVIAREDGGVFIHLHPMGTISAASQLTFELRTAADTLAGSLAARLAEADAERAAHGMHDASTDVLSFPYAFPSTGRYHVWVQVKRRGRVLTGAFVADVAAATAGP